MEDVLNPTYWADRLRKAGKTDRHHSVFRCPADRWARIEAAHRKILARVLEGGEFVLDAGCGYGRVPDLFPVGWRGMYRGVDLSPEMVRAASLARPDLTFLVADLRSLPADWEDLFDLGVCVSVRPMIIRNCGADVWAECERELRRCCGRILYLEYDEHDPGSLE